MRARGGRAAHVTAALIAGLVAVGVSSIAWGTGALDGLEHNSVEARFAVRGAEPPRDVAVVAIDEDTFSTLRTRWQEFPRSLHARAIDRLRAAGAKRIVYDVQFTEPSDDPAQDMALYRAVGRARGTILATTEIGPHATTDVLGGDENLRKVGARAAASNLPEDDKGVLSRIVPDVAGLDTLAAATARAEGHPAPWGEVGGDGVPIDYRGPAKTVPTISFGSVVRGKFDPKVVRGRIVVVGASAPSLQDIHPTPAGRSEMAGPEVQANAIWTALHGLPLRQVPWWEVLLVLVPLAFVAPLASLRRGPVWASVVALGFGAVYVVAAQVAFDRGSLIAVTYPLLALVTGTAGAIAASSLSETRERRRVARYNTLLEEQVRERTEELRATQLEVIRRLGRAAEWRDEETGHHVERISRLSELLALEAGMSRTDAERLGHAAVLHDVGKIGIPDRILLKPGKLDPEEWKLMKSHTAIGSAILADSPSPLVQLAEEIVRTHHERWDGSGYPNGLSGTEIPLAGRICSIVDVFDALRSRRPYKERWSLEVALEEIRRQRGRQFDPQLVDAFLALVPRLDRGLLQLDLEQDDGPRDGRALDDDGAVAAQQSAQRAS
jgi:CHASE2 domain-containing sensor protein